MSAPKGLKSKILELLDGGISRSVISENLGCSTAVVGYYVKIYRPALLSNRQKRTCPDNRICPKCGAPKLFKRPYCRLCYNQYSNERAGWKNNPNHGKYLINRRIKTREFIRKIKSVPCMDCKNKVHWFAMDFDHVRGNKLLAVSVGISRGWSEEKLLKEIEKCDIICSNCHRIRTYNRKYNDNIGIVQDKNQ